jgi:heme-degrading monooxygenase HmoA
VVAVSNGPVVSVLELHVLPGSEQAIARTYEELGVFERARESGGFRSGRLLEPTEPLRPMLVVAEWDDAASYERWLANPVRAELGDHLQSMLADEPAPGGVYSERVRG